jgi:hypothetical protein
MNLQYFSEARGLRKGYGLSELRDMVLDLYNDLRERGHLTEWLGYVCIDAGFVAGTGGQQPGRELLVEIGRRDVWPVANAVSSWTEDGIFDLLQFLGTKVSSPVPDTGFYHDFASCGWHEQEFTRAPARTEFLSRVNKILSRYNDGWEMKADFEIVECAPVGMASLLKAELPNSTDSQMRARIRAAIDKYRRRSSSASDRRDAVRDLGDVLEVMRAEAKLHLSKDEVDLFNILNNFNIRHANAKQKTDYDAIWLSALFYHCLALIHVLTRIVEREATRKR